MGIAYNNSVVRDGLVLHLDAANPKSYPGSGTTWFDLSGNGNNATLSNISYSNKKLIFNGSTSSAFVSNFTPPRDFHTIIVWAKSNVALNNTSSSTSRKTLFKNGSQWNPGLWVNGQVIRPHMPPEYRDKLFSYRSFTDWFSVGQIWDGTNVYTVDNSSISLDTLRSSSYSQSNQDGISIGYESGTTSYTWNGEISLFQIYNRVLTPSEIKQNFEAYRDRYGI